MIISNTSPLLYLVKLGKLELLKKLFKKIIIPYSVYEEAVLKGKEKNFPDAFAIEAAIKDRWIKIEEVKFDKSDNYINEIDDGEAAVIKLAKNLKHDFVLIDDAPARIVAKSLGLKVKGTLYVLLAAYTKKIISKKEIRELIKLLISFGFRISTELYAKILDEIDLTK